MQLGPSACVSRLAAFRAKVLRLLLQLARNPASASAGRSASFHQATASAACERSWRLTPAGIRGPVATPPGMQRGVQSLSVAFLLMAQPTLSALEMIGRPRSERWDFLEGYSGCGNFTAAVFALGMVVGLAVDMVYKAGGLRLDCLLENSQACCRLFSRKLDPAGYM